MSKVSSKKNNLFSEILNTDSLLKEKEKEIVECADCKSDKILAIDGYVVCSNCGFVIKTDITNGAEWNSYTQSDGSVNNKSRCGPSLAFEINPYTKQLSTYLPKGSKSYVTKNGEYIQYDISRLHIQNSCNHLQQSYKKVENVIESSTSDRYSPAIINSSKKMWAEVMKSKKITRAGVRKGLIACCLYYSCIHHDCPRSPIEICEDFGLTDTKNFNKGDKYFKEIFENNLRWSHVLTKEITTEKYFDRFCSKLEEDRIIKEGTYFKLSKKCKDLYKELENDLESLFPKSAACGIIFYICKLYGVPLTKTRLSKCLGICSPTLSKAVKIITKLKKEIK